MTKLFWSYSSSFAGFKIYFSAEFYVKLNLVYFIVVRLYISIRNISIYGGQTKFVVLSHVDKHEALYVAC